MAAHIRDQNYRPIGHFNYTVAFPAPRTLSFQSFKSEFPFLSGKSLMIQTASAILLNTVSLNTTRARKDGYSPGGVRHGPQRVMGKNITDVHFSRDMME